MDFDDTSEEAAFRAEVRAGCRPSMRGHTNRPPPDELMPWYRRLWRQGWIAPDWPKVYCGTGATPDQQIIMTEKLARIAAPHLPAQVLHHIGPILIEFGTEAQKAKHLPPIPGSAMLLSSLLGNAATQRRRYADIAELM